MPWREEPPRTSDRGRLYPELGKFCVTVLKILSGVDTGSLFQRHRKILDADAGPRDDLGAA